MTKKLIRVHVGLARDVQNRLVEAGIDHIEAFAKKLGIANVNAKRLSRFGMLTGDVAAERTGDLRAHEGVEFVEEDNVQKAI